MGAVEPKKIVILGGGFAGISTAMELGRLMKKDETIHVHLVNQENYFVFQPLLPEIVSCAVEPSHILNPIRQLCPDITFHQATTTGIDLKAQTVSIVGTDSKRPRSLPYDHLVMSLGMTMNVSTVPGMMEHTLPLKTLGDAFHLRNHVLSRLEEADTETDEELRRKILTFVTIGGGFSGVETMAALNDMVKAVLPYYRGAQKTGCRMILIHPGERVLNELDAGLAEFAQKKLQARGVEILLNMKVKEATPNGVVLSSGEKLLTGTVICTVGNAPHPLMAKIPIPQDRGRIRVDATLQIEGTTNLWAMGDAALVPDTRRGGWCPPTAQYALRQGRQCAHNVLAAIQAKPKRQFQFGGFGQMAVVGRHCGIAQIFGFKIAGFLAWALWRWVYLMKLPGLRCKVHVGIDWLLEVIFPRDITKIELQRTEQLKHAHFQAGETIIRQGEIGDRFYIIESGEVEIVRQEPGQPEQQLAVRSTGDSFGELALLQDAPRAASVKCLTAVDVIMFNRKDFLTLVGSYDIFRHQMDKETAEFSRPQGKEPLTQETEKAIPIAKA
jgi:NADH dehydrogenase